MNRQTVLFTNRSLSWTNLPCLQVNLGIAFILVQIAGKKTISLIRRRKQTCKFVVKLDRSSTSQMASSSTWSVSVLLLLGLLLVNHWADDLQVQAQQDPETDSFATTTGISDPVEYSVDSNYDNIDTTSFAAEYTSTEEAAPNADGESFSASNPVADYNYDATVTSENTTLDSFASSNVQGQPGSDVPDGFDMNEFVADDTINT